MKTQLSLMALSLAVTATAQPSLDSHGKGESRQAHSAPRSGGRIEPNAILVTPMQALDVVDFWAKAGPAKWFAKDPEFDALFRKRYMAAYEAATRGDLAHWSNTPDGALALILLLDQFPRNSFRNTPRMYATDSMARMVASAAIAVGYHREVPRDLQKFFGLPFAHSENLADQARSVELARATGAEDLMHAEHHRDIVRRFGRFPHRNTILGRVSTAEEQQYLNSGGYKG